LSWASFSKTGTNLLTGEVTSAERRHIARNLDLPIGDGNSDYIRGIVAGNQQPEPNAT
jgi:hypothetical protein